MAVRTERGEFHTKTHRANIPQYGSSWLGWKVVYYMAMLVLNFLGFENKRNTQPVTVSMEMVCMAKS